MKLLVTEIFHSLQGESSLAGLPFAFIRLTGCNLRCNYCDSTYAFHGGTSKSIPEILDAIRPFGVKHVLLTGGEPLLQKNALPLIQALIEAEYRVSIETHGEVSVEAVSRLDPHWTKVIMDIKTPSSGMCRVGYRDNLPLLRPTDEIKFVIASKEDYVWARDLIQAGLPVREVLLSPALPAPRQPKDHPGDYPGVEARWLAERMLEDRLPVRFQLQLHKYIWDPDQRGV